MNWKQMSAVSETAHREFSGEGDIVKCTFKIHGIYLTCQYDSGNAGLYGWSFDSDDAEKIISILEQRRG